ncbi:MAG: hypothetical protein WCS90_01070 [Bacilli bacterium]
MSNVFRQEKQAINAVECLLRQGGIVSTIEANVILQNGGEKFGVFKKLTGL